ncbi:hypothetical protein [Evansella clarkii]|uniref:hypothetical protein n=1 Tax=Evansella clarkii TaxID=79879 RepID=UPI000996250E|nr:hypothetical protein [Evansella clarkii]
MAFTYGGLIREIKQKKEGLMGIQLPMLSMHFIDFANHAGLSSDDYPTIQAYISKASYQEKRAVFEALGFKVLYMTLSAIKVIHFAEGRTDGAPTNPSINQAFLDNQRNVFVLDVEVGMKNLYFVLEYQSDEPLADFTVDREKLAEEQTQKERLRAIFGRNKK